MTGTAAAGAAGALYSIGEVLHLLRPEFGDVTISKIRFLESEGLVDPLRTPSGYRKYTPAHVERLRLVLRAQRDRYLPLRVIREELRGVPASIAASASREREGRAPASPAVASKRSSERGPERAASTEQRHPASARSGHLAAVAPAPLTRAELAERTGMDEAGVADLEQYGLLVPGTDGCYGPEAVTIATIASRLAGYGLQGRHLRPYRATADREVGLLAQLVPPLSKQGGQQGRVRALETVHELAALCAQLHGALVRQGLREMLGT